MLHNYLTILWRNIYRQPVHFILNLSCLTLGITAALLVLLYLDFELNYDRSHTYADRIYRIDTRSITTHEKVIEVDWQSTPANFGPFLQQDYPEIERWVRFFTFWQNDAVNFEYQKKIYEEADVFAADSSVFQIFSFDLIEGNPENALKGPDKIVLSESFAKRIFGDKNPIGEILLSPISIFSAE